MYFNMQNKFSEYRLSSFSVTRIKNQIKEDLNLIDCGKEHFETTYLDTFDWRLFSKNSIIENIRHNDSNVLCWRKLKNRTCQNKIEISSPVDFAWNLPNGQMNERLKKILGVRALIPLATVRVTRHILLKRNKDEKIVLRLLFDQYELLDDKTNQYQKFVSHLILLPVRGYVNALNQVIQYLKKKPGLAHIDNDIVFEIYNHNGYEPGDYSSNPKLQLDTSLRIDLTAKVMLKTFLNTMVLNEEGIRKQIDSEFLHDFRVASRKTRSFCKQLKSVFDVKTLQYYKQSFQWLSSLTGSPRDMDVYLLGFDGYRQMLPESVRDNIEPLREILLSKQKEGYEKLIEALNSERYTEFKNSYTSFLNESVSDHATARNAILPVKEFSKLRIWKIYKLAIKEGNAISKDSPAEHLHELRKTCKKLRYLLDFFQSLYDKNKIARLIKELKKLQDNLGKYNDLHVQINTLNELNAELEQHVALDDDARHAMAELIHHLDNQQNDIRKEFSEYYSKFSSKKNSNMFRKLFKVSVVTIGK